MYFLLAFLAFAAPVKPTKKTPPTADLRCASPGKAMTEADAALVFDELRASVRKENPIDVLRSPKSLDDVLEILRRDQIDLFADGIAFAQKDTSQWARVLEAQLELAWGESMVMVAQLLERQFAEVAMQSLQRRARVAMGQTGADEEALMTSLTDRLQRAKRYSDAMWVLAPLHIAKGAKLTEAILLAMPDDYHGYRVAADYYRLRADWVNFDRMVEQVSKRRPDSTGLSFLLGVALVDRYGQRDAGQKKLEDAVKSDPKFAKAQAMLLLLAETPPERFAALQKLHAINPGHQLVYFVGPSIAATYEAWKENGGHTQPGTQL